MRTNLIIITLAVCAACDRTPPVPRDDRGAVCDVKVGDAATWTGPTEAEALAATAEYAPLEVLWDEATFGDASSSITITVSGTNEAGWVEEREGASVCRSGSELVVPVLLAVEVGDADVTGDVPGLLFADMNGGLYIDAHGAVELSENWSFQAASAFDGTAGDATWYFSIVDEPWAEGATVSIEARNYEGHDDAPLWRGHLEE